MYILHKILEGFVVTDSLRTPNLKKGELCLDEYNQVLPFVDLSIIGLGYGNIKKVIAQQDQIDFSLVEDKITNCKFPVKIKGNFENEVFKIQNIIGKEYEIPIVWESYKRYKVEANNLEEAVTKALKQFLSEPDNEYIDDSFSIDDIIYDENPNENFDIHKIYNSL